MRKWRKVLLFKKEGEKMTPLQDKSIVKIFPSGTKIGEAGKCAYELEKQINAGGEAVVYKAKSLGDGHLVAIKLHYVIEDPLEMKRFRRVEHILRTVKGPNILPLEDAGIYMDGNDSYPYFVFPFISGGRTLENIINECRKLMPVAALHRGTCIPFGDLLYYAMSAGSGLRDAHMRGVQHRDFKPANVLIAGNGRNAVVRVMDFGIARFFDKEQDAKHSKLTVQGFFRGTPEYLSPEQARGGGPDVKGDIWAFGVVLYEMITGVSPFDFEDEHRMSVLSKVTFGDARPTPIDTYCLGVDPLLDALTMRCMEHDPSKRPESMDEILEELNRMELRLPHVSMSEFPQTSLQAEEMLTDPEAATMAAPSTPPKPMPVDMPRVSHLNMDPKIMFEKPTVKKQAVEAADERGRNRRSSANFSILLIASLVVLMVSGTAIFHFRIRALSFFDNAQTEKMPMVKTDPVKSAGINESRRLVTVSASSKPSASPELSVDAGETLDEEAVKKAADSRAVKADAGKQSKAKPRSAKTGYSSQPIPGVDYIPGVD